ncbi:hypothetical protein [Desertimonas flava]|uniref:hypothetical protein n=1 Tax=Desertimonas flava TaxID=2064846 RepID=UPI000E34C936|nr:hypothetical protein [Desertimonas flava]
MVISCDDCVMQDSAACGDCVVTFLLDHDRPERRGAVVLDMPTVRAVRLLADAGLVPDLRHRRAG